MFKKKEKEIAKCFFCQKVYDKDNIHTICYKDICNNCLDEANKDFQIWWFNKFAIGLLEKHDFIVKRVKNDGFPTEVENNERV